MDNMVHRGNKKEENLKDWGNGLIKRLLCLQRIGCKKKVIIRIYPLLIGMSIGGVVREEEHRNEMTMNS